MPLGTAAARWAWWSPDPRGVLPLDGLAVSRSLRRSCAPLRGAGRHRVRRRWSTACADPRRPGGWITADDRGGLRPPARAGWAHSVEAWDDDGLAGGLYGVAIGGLFAGESMFHRRTDASKVALVGARRPAARGRRRPRLLDVQWPTDHLRIARRGRGARGRGTSSCSRRRSRAPAAAVALSGLLRPEPARPRLGPDSCVPSVRCGDGGGSWRHDRAAPRAAGSSLDDPHLLGALHGQGQQRAVPHQPGQGADRPVDRLRPAHPDRATTPTTSWPGRGRQGRRAGRPPRPHGRAARRHPAGRDEHVDDDQRRRRRGCSASTSPTPRSRACRARSCAAPRRTTSSRSTCPAARTSSRRCRRAG